MEKGTQVNLIDRRTGKILGTGKLSVFEDKKISIHHDDGAVTMLQGMNDRFFKIEAR